MLDSRLNIKQLIRTGEFTKRNLNLETTNKQSTTSSTTSNSTGLGVTLGDTRSAGQDVLKGDLCFLPSDILTPTSASFHQEVGSDNTPAGITYTHGKGMDRVSIPISMLNKRPLHTIPEAPQEHGVPPAYQPGAQNIPTISPPPNFDPIVLNGEVPPTPIEDTRDSTGPHFSIYSNSSTIRTSAASDLVSEKNVPANGTPLPNPQVTNIKFSETPLTPSWPLQSPGKSPNTSSLPSYSPYFGSPKIGSGHSSMNQSNSQQSRFSWHMSKQERCSDWFTTWFIEWWALELLSWVFSAVCIVIIISVIAPHSGKALTEWSLMISPNAFISLFSGFAKSALLVPTAQALGQMKWNWYSKGERKMIDFEILDSASRGALGSLMLLTRTKGITLVSVGAAIILLSIPFDLFFQNFVAYPTVWVESGNATIQRSIRYAPTPVRFVTNITTILSPDYDAQAVSIAYIWGQGDTPGTIKDCPTSNCTFPAFDSLSICSSCSEMPKLLEQGCYNSTGDWLSESSPYGATTPNITACGWFWRIPGRPPILMTGYQQNDDGSVGEGLTMRMVPLRDLITRKAIVPDGSINFKDINNPIVDFVVAAVGGLGEAYQNKSPVVHECQMHWCVNSYKSNVWQGVLEETASRQLELDSNDAASPWQDPSWYKPNFTLTTPDPNSVTGERSTYGLNNVTARTTLQIWDTWLPSTLIGKSASSAQLLKWQWRTGFSLRPMDTARWLPPNNVSEFVSNIARATSNQVRRTVNQGDTRAETVQGTAWSQRTLVQIRWYWISLPVILLVMSLGFLLTTIIRSAKEDEMIGVWKTSALPVLLSEVGSEIQERVGTHLRLGHTRKEAKDMKVNMFE